MRLRTLRHTILYFAIGLSWGFVAKTIANTYLYTGYDDPQVTQSIDEYIVPRLIHSDALPVVPDSSAPINAGDSLDVPQETPQGETRGVAPGTVSI